MSSSDPRLFADFRGVWREGNPGRASVIEWDEIIRITGYKLDGITEVYTVLELDHPSGHFMELNADWSGFAQVVDAITLQFPDIRRTWFDEINELATESPPLTVWERR